MDSFLTPDLALTPAQFGRGFSRADLVFYDVDARGASFIARVFIDDTGTEPDRSPERTAGYAGLFAVFGHGGCFGDPGHCDPPDWRDPFDSSPPHPLTPQVKLVDVTERLKATTGEAIQVTVLAISPSTRGAQLIDALQFSSMRLLTYV